MCVDVKTVKFIIRLENTSNKMQQRRKVKDPKIFLVEHVSGKTQWNFINNTKRIYNLNFVFTINLPWKNLDITKNVYFQFFDSQNTFFSNLNPTNLKMFSNHGKIDRFEIKFHINSGDK